MTKALRKIEDELLALAANVEQPDYRVDPFLVRTIARRVGAQAELRELEIDE